MSLRLRKRDKIFLQVLILGITVLIACSCICIFHIFDLGNQFKQEAEKNFEQHVEVAGLVVEDHMNLMQQTVLRTAEAFSNYNKEELEEQKIYDVLREFQNVNDLEELTYVAKDGMTYFPYKQHYVATTGANLELVMQAEPFTRATTGYQLHDTNGVLMAVAPVIVNEEQIGSVVGVKSLKGTLNEKAFEFLRTQGQAFLIDKEGIVLDQSEIAEESNGSTEKNIFDRFKEKVRENVRNEITLADMREKLKAEDCILGELKLADGSDVEVIFRKVNVAQGLFIVECYPESVYKDKVSPIVKKSVTTCGIIIFLMLVVVFFEWFSLKKNNENMVKMAYSDPITKGQNFNYFLDKAIFIISENKTVPYLIQRFDISNFSYINEAYGHIKADELLAIIIEESGKVFGNKELCVRMNADQFVALAQDTTDYLKRMIIFEDNINLRAIDIGIKFPVKLKSGIYRIRKDDYDISVMVDRANVARRSLDIDSKELLVFYSDRIVNDMRKIDLIEADQQRAMIDGEFKVYLQPKWDIYQDKLYGAEALVRWIKDDGSMVYPDAFIPVFEKNGFIEQLDFFMLESVCKEIRRLLDEGKEAFPISVNQSRRLWDNPQYVSNVETILKKYNIPSHYVDLEVTETVFFGEKDKMISIIEQLKEKEVLLSMDDFGSGYSSLNLLKDVPFDILKIDREFFSESITSKSSTWILKKIVEMAEGLGIHVLCEGVETEEQVLLLKDLGCQYVQGYYYSRPIPVKEFMKKYVS